jgi:molybdopterin converting factor subunit 1
MTIHVRFFAIIREKAGRRDVEIEAPGECTIETVLVTLRKVFPEITPYLDRCAFAVNQTYMPVTTPLYDNDELAIIPPVSGG